MSFRRAAAALCVVLLAMLGILTANTLTTGSALPEPSPGAVIEINQPSEVFDPRESYSFEADGASEALAATIAAESGPR